MLGRKLFSSGLALGLMVSVVIPAHADLLKNLKMDGSIEVRTFGIDNEIDRNSNTDDYRSDMRTRLMLGTSFDLLDDVHSRVLLRKNNRLDGQDSSGVGAGSSENLNQVQSAIAVDNAYVKIDKVFSYVDFTIGRQFYGNSDDPVLYFGANNDDILSVNAVDVFRADADIMGGWAKFQGLAGKMLETTALSATNPPAPSNVNSDTDIWGGQLSTDKVIPKGNLALAYNNRTIKGPGVAGNNTLYVGQITAIGDLIAGLGYDVAFMQDFGRNSTTSAPGGNLAYNGTAYLLGLKYGMDMDGKPVRAHGEFGRGTDNFAAISPGKRFGLIWGEHSTVGPSTINRGANGFAAGLSNLKVLDLGAGINPIAKLGVDVAWYRFMYDAYTAGFSTSAGSEYDLILSWKHSDNVSFDVNLASFQVGQALANPSPTGTNPITRVGADVSIKF